MHINLRNVHELNYIFDVIYLNIDKMVSGKNGTGNNRKNGKIGKIGTFSILGFGVGLGV